ncbi:hypothetical protein J7K43_02570 [Candidatus Calescamantes bacterium]|nr:hypothetical protein [Candidatus Calescamantes bacterium]
MYNLKFHKTLTPSRWREFAPSQQILMIANELNRAKNALLRKDTEEVKECYERAIELLDLTINVSRKRNQRKELLRFREILGLEYLRKEKNVSFIEMLTKTLTLLDEKAFNLLNP